MAYAFFRPDEQVFAPPSWRPDEPTRRVVELTPAGLKHSRANLWRYPPGARGRRHRETVQEEVFVVLEGTITMLLGDEPEQVELPRGSVVVVEPGTPLQIRNETESEALMFIYGAPPVTGRSEVLPEPA